jgi:hypothetical protein
MRTKKTVTFEQLAEEYDGMTWDHPVECSDDITNEQRDKICQLGYYGKPIKPEHAAKLEKGEKYKTDAPYVISYHGCDGHDQKEFKTIEEAKEYIEPRIEWCNSDTQVGTEFATYTLDGFTLKDIGVNWKDRQP